MKYCFLLILNLFILTACVSIGSKPSEPPKLTEQSNIETLISASIDYGDETLKSAKKIISKLKIDENVENLLVEKITKNYKIWQPHQLINAINLYHFVNPKNPDQIFSLLITRDETITRQLAWHLAKSFPSKLMENKIDYVLSNALKKDELNDFLIPNMAEAIVNNQMKNFYTILREGLFYSNQPAFARAMIQLNPQRAASDFLNYLAKATPEELRQLNTQSVDVFVCTEILNHLAMYEVPITHSNFEILYYYAVSRNLALAEMAYKVVNTYIAKDSNYMAIILSKLPLWTQIAYIESSNAKAGPRVSFFLKELRKITPHKEVKEEIDHVK